MERSQLLSMEWSQIPTVLSSAEGVISSLHQEENLRTKEVPRHVASETCNNFGTNGHVATSSRPTKSRTNMKSKKPYSIKEEVTLVLAVAIHGRKWQIIAETYFQGTGRTIDNLKQKWKHMMEIADTEMASPERKVLHILAAVVQVAAQKDSKYKEQFGEWFKKMGEQDRGIKLNADGVVRMVKEKNLSMEELLESNLLEKIIQKIYI